MSHAREKSPLAEDIAIVWRGVVGFVLQCLASLGQKARPHG